MKEGRKSYSQKKQEYNNAYNQNNYRQLIINLPTDLYTIVKQYVTEMHNNSPDNKKFTANKKPSTAQLIKTLLAEEMKDYPAYQEYNSNHSTKKPGRKPHQDNNT